ncbi:hypothetical protein TWF730_006118 [Orbilia blumenaviensis]|uniref:Rhodopsin domain-containing protein n=1 Tax=Orbilia blumenaviensis TaxID=1796055 RepID=A0AAV9TZE2_9PEZI
MAGLAAENGSSLKDLTIATAIVSILLCTTGVAARLFTRLKDANQHLYPEDWILIGPAYISTMGVACAMIAATTYQLGSHVGPAVPIKDIVKLMKTLYALQIVILIALGAIRASLLYFIRRLSKTSSTIIYKITSGLIFISTAHIIVSIFSSIFRCNPISTVWTPGAVKYTCASTAAVYVLVSVGLAIDALMFLLPAILVVSLHITKKKKLQSLVMFALGGGGCIIEALRFGQLQEAKTSTEPIYTSGKIVIFLFIQAVLGMLCCCAPSIKAFGTHLITSKLRSTKSIRSYSDNMGGTTVHDASNATCVGDDIEGGHDMIFREDPPLSQFATMSSDQNIEMGIQGAGMVNGHNKKDGTMVMERIMDLKEVLKLCEEETGSLAAPRIKGGSRNLRSESSQTYEEFHAKPMEWGKQL